MGKAAYQGLAVKLLEFIEFAAVDEPGNDLMHVKGVARVGRDYTVQFLGG